MKIILPYLLFTIICGFFSSFIANEKNRDSKDWFWLGFFFNIIALLALIAVPILPKKESIQPVKKSDSDHKPNSIPNDLTLLIKSDDNNKQLDDSLNNKLVTFCLFCGEIVSENETVCPSCKKKIK